MNVAQQVRELLKTYETKVRFLVQCYRHSLSQTHPKNPEPIKETLFELIELDRQLQAKVKQRNNLDIFPFLGN